MRREDGTIEVDDYTTVFFRNRTFVTGGKLDYKDNLKNAGGQYSFGNFSEDLRLGRDGDIPPQSRQD